MASALWPSSKRMRRAGRPGSTTSAPPARGEAGVRSRLHSRGPSHSAAARAAVHHPQRVLRPGHDFPCVSVQGHGQALRVELVLLGVRKLGQLGERLPVLEGGVGTQVGGASADADPKGSTRMVIARQSGAQHEQSLTWRRFGRTRLQRSVSLSQSSRSRGVEVDRPHGRRLLKRPVKRRQFRSIQDSSGSRHGVERRSRPRCGCSLVRRLARCRVRNRDMLHGLDRSMSRDRFAVALEARRGRPASRRPPLRRPHLPRRPGRPGAAAGAGIFAGMAASSRASRSAGTGGWGNARSLASSDSGDRSGFGRFSECMIGDLVTQQSPQAVQGLGGAPFHGAGRFVEHSGHLAIAQPCK